LGRRARVGIRRRRGAHRSKQSSGARWPSQYSGKRNIALVSVTWPLPLIIPSVPSEKLNSTTAVVLYGPPSPCPFSVPYQHCGNTPSLLRMPSPTRIETRRPHRTLIITSCPSARSTGTFRLSTSTVYPQYHQSAARGRISTRWSFTV
jgi:hypothetical protein